MGETWLTTTMSRSIGASARSWQAASTRSAIAWIDSPPAGANPRSARHSFQTSRPTDATGRPSSSP